MCTTALLAAQVGLNIMGASQAEAENDRANARAQAGLMDTGDAIIANLGFQTAEINRQIGDVNQAEFEGLSDFEREARAALGKMRSQETSLTSGSLSRIYFENQYVTNESRGRIKANAQRGRDALQAEKEKSAQDALNSWTQAKNQTGNIISQNNANSSAAWMGAISNSVSAGVQYVNNTNIQNIAKQGK